MRRAMASILLVFYLFTSTEFGQFLRLPILIQHFHQHKEDDGIADFLDFLAAHYNVNKPIDEDHHEDTQLPFNSHNGCTHSINIIASFTLSVTPVLPQEYHHEISHTIFQEQPYIPSFTANIWQPPKKA